MASIRIPPRPLREADDDGGPLAGEPGDDRCPDEAGAAYDEHNPAGEFEIHEATLGVGPRPPPRSEVDGRGFDDVPVGDTSSRDGTSHAAAADANVERDGDPEALLWVAAGEDSVPVKVGKTVAVTTPRDAQSAALRVRPPGLWLNAAVLVLVTPTYLLTVSGAGGDPIWVRVLFAVLAVLVITSLVLALRAGVRATPDGLTPPCRPVAHISSHGPRSTTSRCAATGTAWASGPSTGAGFA